MVERPFSADLQRNFRDQTGCPGAPKVIDDEVPAQAVILMGANFDGTNALYTRTGTFESPFASNQTAAAGSVSLVSTGATVYTVTTGKTFYLMGYNVGNTGIAGAWSLSGFNVSVRGAMAAGAGQQNSATVPMAVGTSGAVIAFNHGSGANLGIAHIWGFEQ